MEMRVTLDFLIWHCVFYLHVVQVYRAYRHYLCISGENCTFY